MTETDVQDPPVAQAGAEPTVSQPSTLQNDLRAVKKRAQNRHSEDFAIPGYGGRLWGTFKALDDYADVRAVVEKHSTITDPALNELHIAADILVKSCVEVFAVEDDKKHPLGMGLGAALADYLGDPVENDRQGVFAVFPNTLAVMTLYGELDRWFKAVDVESSKEAAGNSVAPSL